MEDTALFTASLRETGTCTAMGLDEEGQLVTATRKELFLECYLLHDTTSILRALVDMISLEQILVECQIILMLSRRILHVPVAGDYANLTVI